MILLEVWTETKTIKWRELKCEATKKSGCSRVEGVASDIDHFEGQNQLDINLFEVNAVLPGLGKVKIEIQDV